MKRLNINGREVLLDKDVLKTLITYNVKSRRKHPIPLAITSKEYVQWSQSVRGERTLIFLQHFVVGVPLKGYVCDHINRNPLDNRRENLRIVTRRENHHNMKNNNKYIGTYSSKEKWCAQIRTGEGGKQRVNLGTFDTEEVAGKAYSYAKSQIDTGEELDLKDIKLKFRASRVKGYCWSKVSGKWQAGITIDSKQKHLGLFKTEEEAAKAYEEASIRYDKK